MYSNMLKIFKMENKSFFERVAKDFKDSDIDFNYYEKVLYYAYEKTFDLAMDFLIEHLISCEYEGEIYISFNIYDIENFGDDLCKRIINLIKKTIHKNTNEMPSYYDLESIVNFTFNKIKTRYNILNIIKTKQIREKFKK